MRDVAAMRPEHDALNCPPPSQTPSPEPRIVAEGWEPRFLADPARAEEVTELYHHLGFEVRAEAVPTERLGEYCEGCQAAICHVYVMIYTRRLASPSRA